MLILSVTSMWLVSFLFLPLLLCVFSYSHGTNLQHSAVPVLRTGLTKIDVTGAPRSYVFFPCAQWTASANNHRARSIIRLAGDLVQDDVAARCTAAHWRDTCTAIDGALRSTLYTSVLVHHAVVYLYIDDVYRSVLYLQIYLDTILKYLQFLYSNNTKSTSLQVQ